MLYAQALRVLALPAVLPAGATLYFVVFWGWFAFWRRHRVATYVLMFGTLIGLGVAVWVWRQRVLGEVVALPGLVHAVGWGLVVIANLFGWVADRQLGLRVRAFTPFFEEGGSLELKTTGAYGVVRHPIYAAGLWYQVGVFLVTGVVAVAAAALVFGLGALWFTRQEEARLVRLLRDPAQYQRYRAAVPALLPWPRRRP